MSNGTGRIYCIMCKCNEKIYIGKTIHSDIDRYFYKHLHNAHNDKKSYNRPLCRAIRKYGDNNFHIEVIHDDIPANRLNDYEIFYIGYFNSYINSHNSCGYNATIGGDGGSMHIWSEESKQKLSASLKCSELYLDSRVTLIGKEHSKKHRSKISLSMAGTKNHFYGKVHSDKTKKKMRDAKLRILSSDEIIDIISMRESNKSYRIITEKHRIGIDKIKRIIKENNNEQN